ncbi:MAG: DnaJ C-terminal domain-containing protein [Eubacteriaceae bacterium]|jgi:curved DNA-binding protein CbpA
MNIESVLHKISIGQIYQRNGSDCVLDPFRKKLLQITPEEVVRQKISRYFIDDCGVPKWLMSTEEHLKHYNGKRDGRMDIVFDKIIEGDRQVLGIIECKAAHIPLSDQTYRQVKNYADDISAEFIFITNGIEIKGWRFNIELNQFEALKGIPTYEKMLDGRCEVVEEEAFKFERGDFLGLFDIAYLKTLNFLGEDTPDLLIPSIFNLAECLIDTSHMFPVKDYGDFAVVEDIGCRYLGYNDASGSNFGTGLYRTLLIKDGNQNHQLISFLISAVGRTVNDPKYGNRKGKNVLVVSLDDYEKDSMVVQIDFIQFMKIDKSKTILTHNGSVSQKSARKGDLIELIFEKYPYLIKGDMIQLGELLNTGLLYMDTPCVIDLIVNLIRYTLIRDDYKKFLNQKNKNEKESETMNENKAVSGLDITKEINMSFYEAVSGAEKKVEFIRTEKCSVCNGTGTDENSVKCSNCQGTGLEEKKRTITINIPAGVDDKSVLPLRGEGNAGPNDGEKGDLYININVAQSNVFIRKEDDVCYELPISFTQAFLGCSVIVPTLNGKINLKIPSHTKDGRTFRLKDKGMLNPNTNEPGDQLITIKVEMPKNLNAEQLKMIEDLENCLGLDCYPEAKDFLAQTEAEYKMREMQ